MVERREIQLTGPELGRGGWATVSVATFRGVRVATKCIHDQIISHYNLNERWTWLPEYATPTCCSSLGHSKMRADYPDKVDANQSEEGAGEST